MKKFFFNNDICNFIFDLGFFKYIKFILKIIKKMFIFFITFYINFISFFLTLFDFIKIFFIDYFYDFILDFISLLKSKWILIFLILLPIISTFIWIQFLSYFIWFFYFTFVFLLYYVIDLPLVLEIKEVPFNGKYPFSNFIYQFFNFIPKCRSHIIFYFSLKFLLKKDIKLNKNQLYIYFILSILFFILFFIKYLFFFFMGFTYLTFTTTVIFTKKIEDSYKYSAVSIKARCTDIFVNICGYYFLSVLSAIPLRIIFKERDEIIFNPGELEALIKKLNSIENFKYLLKTLRSAKNFNIRYVQISNKEKPHFSIIESYKNELNKTNLFRVNSTSSKELLVDENQKLDLGYGFIPNMVGQNKPNYIVPAHFIPSSIVFHEINERYNTYGNKLQMVSKLILDINQPIYNSNRSGLSFDEHNPTLSKLIETNKLNSNFWENNYKFNYFNKNLTLTPEEKKLIEIAIYSISKSDVSLDELIKHN